MAVSRTSPRAARLPAPREFVLQADDQAIDSAWAAGRRNADWVDKHWAELEHRHAGHWLCVADAKLVIAEPDRERFLERLQAYRGKADAAPLVLYVPRPEDVAGIHPFPHLATTASV